MATHHDKSSGRFRSVEPRDPFALYELIRVVAQRAAKMVNAAAGVGAIPVLPQEVTMLAFDAAAATLVDEGDYKSVPPARSIGKLLPDRDDKPFSWHPLLELVFDERSIERVHMERLSASDNLHLNDDCIYYGLNRIAQLLKRRTFSSIEYQVQRERLVRADNRRPNGGHLASVLPTFGQIDFYIRKKYDIQTDDDPTNDDVDDLLDSVEDEGAGEVTDAGGARRQVWVTALKIAELDPAPAQPHITKDRVSALDASLRFYEVVGFLPSSSKLRRFARDFGFALEDIKVNWPREFLPLVRAEIERRGLPEPPQYDPRRQKLEWKTPAVSPWENDPAHRPKTFYTRPMVLSVIADFRDWLPRGQAPTTIAYAEFSRDDPNRPTLIVIHEHGGLDQLFDELADPDALEAAYRELNPTAEELEARAIENLEKKLRHPTPQAILRVITERGEASAREIAEEIGVDKGTVNNWIPLLMQANKIDSTTPSRVAKNVKYCLKGKAPSLDEVKRRKLVAQVNGERCQKVLELLREHGELTAKELGTLMGSLPETVTKWLRPLKELDVVEQIVENSSSGRRTYYRVTEAGLHA